MKGCPQGIEAARAQMALGRLQELFLAGRLDALGLSARPPLASLAASAAPLPSPGVDGCWAGVRGCEGTRCACPHLQLTLQRVTGAEAA